MGKAAELPGWPGELAGALQCWLPRQRWFAGKGTPLAGVRVVDHASLGEGQFWVLVEARGVGPAASVSAYQIFVSRLPEGGEPSLRGLSEDSARQAWFHRIAQPGEVESERGRLRFESFAAPGELVSSGSQLGSAEQSNTSVIYRDRTGERRWVLKFFRHLLPGENPEFEVPRALAAHTSFVNVPRPAGRVRYQANGLDYTLATLQPFLANRGDGWEYVLAQLRDRARDPQLLAEIALLGQRTAELHRALASIPEAEFAPEPIALSDLEHWRERALTGASAPPLRGYQDLLAGWVSELRNREAAAGLDGCLGCARIRLHGDYHLGQVLKTETDFYLFDFEGEPVRPLQERRRKGCVLQDVAGMLRSFGYAAATAERPEWEAGAREAFLTAYRGSLGPEEQAREGGAAFPLAPSGKREFEAGVRFFEFEKAVYELAYEITHRPDWVRVPLGALRRMSQRPAAG